jgi:hypothetical protein
MIVSDAVTKPHQSGKVRRCFKRTEPTVIRRLKPAYLNTRMLIPARVRWNSTAEPAAENFLSLAAFNELLTLVRKGQEEFLDVRSSLE